MAVSKWEMVKTKMMIFTCRNQKGHKFQKDDVSDRDFTLFYCKIRLRFQQHNEINHYGSTCQNTAMPDNLKKQGTPLWKDWKESSM